MTSTTEPNQGQVAGGLPEPGRVPLPPLVLLDADGVVTHVSDSVPPIWGYDGGESFLGRRCREFCAEPEKLELAAAEYRQNGFWQGNFTTRRRDGSPMELHARAWMMHTRGTLYQTMMVLLPSAGQQEQFSLFGPHKMVVVPEVMVRGIVHDINNALMVPTGMLSCLQSMIDPGNTSVHDTLKDCVDGCMLASGVARQMGDWLRTWMDRSGEQEAVDIGRLVRVAVRLAMSGSHTRVVFEGDEWAGAVLGEKATFFRVFLNLALNARQAMRDEGRLVVRTEGLLDGEADRRRRHVRISMTDTGGGIAPALMDRIFKMGFSTKQGSGDRGIGLAVSAQMVRENHGRIEVESEEGVGTTFHVWLPLMHPDPGTPAASPP